MPESPDLLTESDVWEGNWVPSLVAFDLDDTLAPSKSPVHPSMLSLLVELLGIAEVCVISGGQIAQFRSQLVDPLSEADSRELRKLHLMPTCGTQYWRHDGSDWRLQYAENLEAQQTARALESLERRAKQLGL